MAKIIKSEDMKPKNQDLEDRKINSRRSLHYI